MSEASIDIDEAKLSPREAAELLRMSCPTVIRLLATGKIGADHRLSHREVLEFKEKQLHVRRVSLEALAEFRRTCCAPK